MGRPANLVRVDGGKALFLGIKVTGDEIIAVLTDLRCRIRLARHVRLTGRAPVLMITDATLWTGGLNDAL
ncbi:hypothetical protein GCM10010339_38760 [Streptomyces alanosinicus]|uniref:Uncharacterized protein n=1 Tax=Streptomyces alanosinicus TaxID=68171 RepID=A0A918YIC8_9ACTN|nr:hypothetical protein GCM10010339_38760 [Streptomyces alanosinicus]